jgi:hypothetical protein
MPHAPELVLRFGDQLDTQTVNGGPTGQLTPEHAARYIAKYATKSAEHFGLGHHRITPEALPRLDVTSHVNRLVHTAWQLGEHPTHHGLRRWIHMIGFRGQYRTVGSIEPHGDDGGAGSGYRGSGDRALYPDLG